MAFNQGISNNTTPCEKLRKDHGPFTIPAPQGETPEKKPFGIPLTRSSKFDYERVQVRIAAVQAGMRVDEEEGGLVTIPENILRTAKHAKIKRLSDVLDYYWIRTFQTKVLRTKDRPAGFRPEMWKSASVIQSRIRRERKVDCRAKSKKTKASAPGSSKCGHKPGEQSEGLQPAATEGSKDDSPNSVWVEGQGTAIFDEFLDFTSLQENSQGELNIIVDGESEEEKEKEREREKEREGEKERQKETEKERKVEKERAQMKEEEKRRAALHRERLGTARSRQTNALALEIQLWRERMNQRRAATSSFDYMYLSDGN